MATFTGIIPSGSTNGRSVLVVATASPGTIWHTAVAGTAAFDEITMDCENIDTVDRTLTFEYGGVASPGDRHPVVVPFQAGPMRILTRWRLQNGLILRVFASAANVLLVNGNINRVS